MKALLFFLPLLALFASCSREPSRLLADLNSHRWELIRLTVEGVDEDLSQSRPNDRCLQFRGSRVSGTAGVNHFSLVFRITDPDRIAVTDRDSGMTEMAGPAHLMELEEAYFGAIRKVSSAVVNGSTLTMQGDAVTLVFRGYPPRPAFPGDPEEPVSGHDAQDR